MSKNMPKTHVSLGAVSKFTVDADDRASSTPAKSLDHGQNRRLSAARSPSWVWTKVRRAALKLILYGVPGVEVARRVGVHRHTIENWTKRPEWRAEMRQVLDEQQLATRLRRLRTTSVIADRLGAKSLEALRDDDVDPKRAGLVLREHLNYVAAEQEWFGEGEHEARKAHGVHIFIGPGGVAPVDVDPDRRAAAVLDFKKFMAGYDPAHAIRPLNRDQEEAILKGRVPPPPVNREF